MKFTPRERFLAKVCPEPGTGCWLWRGTMGMDGYGIAIFEGKPHAAHRVGWMLFHSDIAPGLVVCHKCDVRACVNPDHLFLGTMMDNVRDMEKKGRSPRGEEHHCAKLTAEHVKRIRDMLAEDRMYIGEIAQGFGVAHSTISSIKRGKTWRHVQAAATPKPEPEDDPVDQTTQEPSTPNNKL